MVRDLDERETRNGETMKSYWVTMEVKQEDCVRRNKRKRKRERVKWGISDYWNTRRPDWIR